MSGGSFTQHVSGFTSDHTWLTATVASYAKDGTTLSLKGLTWNLLNLAHSKRDNYKHRNNPFDADESEAEYLERKRQQLHILAQLIKSGNLDFVVLQEADIFTRKPLPEFVTAFIEEIGQDWLPVHSDPADNVRMPLITFYNAKKLILREKRPVLPDAKQKNCALEARFNYVGTNEDVCITNMHLDFDTDHRQAILDYQYAKIAANQMTIIAGDATHAPDKELPGLVGDQDRATNISVPLPGQTPKDSGPLVLQRPDGFMASPAHPEARVSIIEELCANFLWAPANKFVQKIKSRKDPDAVLGKYVWQIFDPQKEKLSHTIHISLPGMPWIRDKYKHLLLGAPPQKGVGTP